MKRVIVLILALSSFCVDIIARSPFRKKDKDEPQITIGWKGFKKGVYRSSNWAFKKSIFTIFNHDYFYSHLLPHDYITDVHNPHIVINSEILNKLIENLLREIKKHKTEYTHFDILKDKNFNRHARCGLLILKFKDYPFVLKLFMETPKTFINSYCKGFENQFFLYMSGMNRHSAGLTRIRNLELVKQQIENHARWKNKVITPRKWHWIPKKPQWMEIKGYNIGGEKEVSTLMPSVYAVIADVLDTTEDAPLLSLQKRSELVMQLCMDLQLFVDPHGDNFVVKYNEADKDYHISIVDTEHFPSLVGLKEQPFFNNHLEYYVFLGAKYFQDAFLQTKFDRKEAQNYISPCALQW